MALCRLRLLRSFSVSDCLSIEMRQQRKELRRRRESK